ncbi:endonuclease [Flavobacterium psychrotolerans]|uniref:Ribonuclease n=1 Tax=Flavobacterium psychrotolerans TaxID=2169410 RepID=A0A2U1JRC6_9FLAO|nr:endonuclease [Flavobacterium psychrotolerans]PWA07509.1 ribonuclease [Flavobacterium psychrotolerans]
MKKNYYLVSLLLLVSFCFAQAPAGYYNNATGTGYALKTQLYNIIKGHTDQSYQGLYNTYLTSDIDVSYEKDGTILDMYSENPTGADPYNFSSGSAQRCGSYSKEGDCYNREHIIPQSIFNSESPMVSDAHFITPTDGTVNGLRSNYPHGKVGTASKTTLNGSKLGSASNTGYATGFTGMVFEPIDEFKGDIARMYFYFATRYENVITTWGNSYAPFNGTSDQVFTDAYKNILLTWNAQDPVSPREIARNNAIYARQKNRNPYIDNNAYVTSVWGSPILAVSTYDILAGVSVYPNPTNNHRIDIQTETVLDEINLISVNGQIIQQIKNPLLQNNTYTLENLSKGFYFLKLTSNNQSVTKKVIVN